MADDALEDAFLTVAEVAAILKLNQQTVRNWIDQGSLPAVRVGKRRVRIRRSDLERLLAHGYVGDVKTAAQSAAIGANRLRDADPGESQHPRGATRLGTADPWQEFGAAAGGLSEAVGGRNPGDIADAFRTLADAAGALSDAIAAEEQTN